MNFSQLPAQILDGIFSGSIYALFALGYTLIFGVLDILNLAHAAIFMLGAMVSWWLVSAQGWPLWVAFPVAVVMAGPIGKAELFHPVNGKFRGRELFDANAPVLPGFSVAPAFVF